MLDYRKLDLQALNDLFYKLSLTQLFYYKRYDYTMPLTKAEYEECQYLLANDKYFNEQFVKFQQHNSNVNRKKNRVYFKIQSLLEKDCVFLTLTFKTDILNKYSNEKLRELVSRYLKKFKVGYVANIDFGSQFGRVHFHAVLQKESIDLSSWKYGFILSEKIHAHSENAISRYITKLSYHAFKDSSGKDFRLIYSRDNLIGRTPMSEDLQFKWSVEEDFYNNYIK